MESKKGNFMDAGKTVTGRYSYRVFLVQSDVSQIKDLYSGEDGEKLAKHIFQNCNLFFRLKPGQGGKRQ